MPPYLQLSLSWKGGCDIGEAPAIEGEVKEKPTRSGLMGKEGSRTGKQRHSPHSHTPSPHTHSFLSPKPVQLREQWNCRNPETPISHTEHGGGLQATGVQSSALCQYMYGSKGSDVAAGDSQKDELGAAVLSP